MKTKVGGYLIEIERDLCIGAATCVAIAPQTFNLDEEAKAIVLEAAAGDTDETILDAAKSCPTAAIILTNEKGERIFP
ncbi:ferredoxin [Candidatus Microgenomates bacterium]|nr:ferredoxin [Candidatus Microgenomates bacterium]